MIGKSPHWSLEKAIINSDWLRNKYPLVGWEGKSPFHAFLFGWQDRSPLWLAEKVFFSCLRRQLSSLIGWKGKALLFLAEKSNLLSDWLTSQISSVPGWDDKSALWLTEMSNLLSDWLSQICYLTGWQVKPLLFLAEKTSLLLDWLRRITTTLLTIRAITSSLGMIGLKEVYI